MIIKKIQGTTMLEIFIISTLTVFVLSNALASQLTSDEEITVCKMGFSAVNYNPIGNYSFLSKTGDTLLLKSTKYSDYSCEIFSDGHIMTLSTPSWGRIKPTGNISKAGNCLIIKLYDPGLNVHHNLNSCN